MTVWCYDQVCPKLRELAPAARGSNDAGSRNLGLTILAISVHCDANRCS